MSSPSPIERRALLLAIDQGRTNTKVLPVDAVSGEVVALAYAPWTSSSLDQAGSSRTPPSSGRPLRAMELCLANQPVAVVGQPVRVADQADASALVALASRRLGTVSDPDTWAVTPPTAVTPTATEAARRRRQGWADAVRRSLGLASASDNTSPPPITRGVR